VENNIMLSVHGLSVRFKMYGKGLKRHDLHVIRNLNIDVRQGEILAVAGSSGSGKSLLAHAILGILPTNALVEGDIRYKGKRLCETNLKKLRGNEIAFVPQSIEYLDPLMKVGKQVSKDKAAVRSAFERYKLDESTSKLFQSQLSGGMMRRVLCATAVVSAAKLIIADEPTPGMSADLAKRAMKHFRDLADEGAAVMLITHDLDLAIDYADRVAVFYAGTTVETAFSSDFSEEGKLRHPYSKALWRAMPQNGFYPTAGSQPEPGVLLKGCLYAERCTIKNEKCLSGVIEPRIVRGGEVCCWYAN
jgi:peptide/nickel transport system ATP-binding protein